MTLHESEADYSPTTMYEDYAISPRLFHWQLDHPIPEDACHGARVAETA